MLTRPAPIADNPPVPATVIVVHYNAIALKGGNRSWFEQRLRENLAEALREIPGTKVRSERGRIVAVIHDASPAAAEEACARVGKVPGIAWFAAAEQVERSMEAI